MFFLDVSFIAVIVAALVVWFIGWLWYSDYLFGKIWRAHHVCKDDTCCKSGWCCAACCFAISFATAWVFAALLGYLNIHMMDEGLFIGFMIWLGFIVTNYLYPVICDKQHIQVYFIHTGYQFVKILVLAGILSAWN